MSETESSQKPIDIYEYLAVLIDQTAMLAWAKLGLQPDPASGTLGADLVQAKAAIDAASSLASIVEPRLDEDDRRRVQSLVRDLKMNYVSREKTLGENVGG